MTLVDTSAWIEFFRATGSDANLRLREMIQGRANLATTEVVHMELLAGARSARELTAIGGALSICEMLPMAGLDDYEAAAAIYRQCRGAGITPRQLNDCVVAAVAYRNDVPVLHHDRDFEMISSVFPLRIAE